jgi:hypothetical protein
LRACSTVGPIPSRSNTPARACVRLCVYVFMCLCVCVCVCECVCVCVCVWTGSEGVNEYICLLHQTQLSQGRSLVLHGALCQLFCGSSQYGMVLYVVFSVRGTFVNAA